MKVDVKTLGYGFFKIVATEAESTPQRKGAIRRTALVQKQGDKIRVIRGSLIASTAEIAAWMNR